METNELTINSLVDDFTEKQIKEAISYSGIENNNPLKHIIAIARMMHLFIISHHLIDDDIKEEYCHFWDYLAFHEFLLKQIPGIEL